MQIQIVLKLRPNSLLLAGAMIAVPHLAHGALSVTDGGFSDPAVADGGNDTNFTNWFDDAGGNNFSSFIFHSTAEFGAGSNALLALGPGGGYIYQSLGTRDAGEDFLSVTIDAYERPNTTRQFPTLNINFYAGDFATAANGTDIDASLTSIGTLTISGADLFTTPGDGSDGESQIGFTLPGSVDLTGEAEGTEIWMRVNSPDANGNPLAAYVDNVTVANVPEPSSLGLLALGGLALLRRRR